MELQENFTPDKVFVKTSFSKKWLAAYLKFIGLLLLLCLGSSAFAQDLIRNTQNGISSTPTDTSLLLQNVIKGLTGSEFVTIAPTTFNATSTVKIEDFSNYGVLLELESNYINELRRTQPEKLQMTVPVSSGASFDLQLTKVNITTADFAVKTSSGTILQQAEDANLFYWGIVSNDPGSIAAVSFFEDEVRCVIADKDGNYVMGAYEDAHVLYADKDLKQSFNFDCTTSNDFFGEESNENINGLLETQLIDFINIEPIIINVECDYSMYLSFDTNIEKIKEYVTALFNESAILYANENIKIEIGEIYVWDSQDPYDSYNSTLKILEEFSGRNIGKYTGKVAMFLTDRDLPFGTGHAYIGGLCTPDRNFGVVRVFNTDSVVPVSSYSRDVYTFTHELGHIFGSQHTHACAWGPSGNEPLDNCAVDSLCAYGSQPINGGTIMSYCIYEKPFHMNFDNGFGEEPGNLIRAYVNRRNCVDPEPCQLEYNPQVFIDHPWLNEILINEDCTFVEISVYGNWVFIKTFTENYIYIDGELFCTDHANLDCFEFYTNFFPAFSYSSCGCACEDAEICNTDPCFDGGVQMLNEDCECAIIEPTNIGCANPAAPNYDPTVNCPDNSMCDPIPPPNQTDICNENEGIFNTYAWLSDIIDLNNCSRVKIKEYYSQFYQNTFVEVISPNSATLYYYTGYEMCTNCLSSYSLTDQDKINECSCGDGEVITGCIDETACNYNANANQSDGSCTYFNSFTGKVFHELCDDGRNYYFIQLSDGTIIDPYNAEGVNFSYPNGAVVEFGYIERGDSPCSIADKAVTIVCISEIDCEENSGTVFYEACDNGQIYYFIRLPDGRVIDPYNADWVNFNYLDGASVKFAYINRGDSPCSNAEKAVTIVCINESGVPNPTVCDYAAKGTVFYEVCVNDGDEYYFIRLNDGTIVDPYNTEGVFFDYPDEATVEFTYTLREDTPCSNSDKAVDVICIREVFDDEPSCDQDRTIFNNYPFLETIVDPNNCNGATISLSNPFIIIEMDGTRNLYLTNGTFYCDWDSCIDFYLPDGAPCVWNCNGLANKSSSSSTGIQPKKIIIEIEIIPNPNRGHFTIKLNNKEYDANESIIQVHNLEGKLLKTIENSGNLIPVNISEFGKGIYLLSVTTADLYFVEKLIIN